MNLCSRFVSSATWRFSTKASFESWAREERRKGCVVLKVFAGSKDMAGETVWLLQRPVSSAEAG